ncbi:polyketide synthase [Aspergillus fijiensis CBS 313.89]|uniref:Polyketide synthase n=1 Tax=Aspergillus fijiensis CBS 313.89 TaxID=1448319 RepID=A0A8G1RTS9_9EURO|nr:polyketide synthase [Aspergillus fijiensis CBS 313.89]RAK77710.1 polyketide synthase [Aspergillus fijiensis CBS 313.89]
MAQSSLDDISPSFEHSAGISPSSAAAQLPTATETMSATHPNDNVDDTGFPAPVPIAIMLIDKRDGLCRVPRDRYNIDAFYHCDGVPGTIRTEHGYFLQQDIAQIDTGFFGMSKIDASKLDPQQRILLEVVWECMENAGQTDWQGTNIGCYVGNFGEDLLDLASKDTLAIDRYRVMGTGDFALANNVPYQYDLRGPSVVFRTGCSSSMVALHEACQALYSECLSAIVAGTSLIITPTMSITTSVNMVLSPSGTCRTFDENADGYGRGEAINAIFITPLDAAMRDGDSIRAVIRSTSQAQERLIRRTYHKAGIEDIDKTAFFECHGTGTAVGDVAETSVVAEIFGKNGIYIGAVKPNVGHSEGASGITSIIKCALALEKRTIPPNVFFEEPNSKIPFEQVKLKVPVEAIPWPSDRHERVSMNSFGIGGTNAHVVIDSAASICGQRPENKTDASLRNEVPHLLLHSAKSSKSLDGNIQNADYFEAYQRFVVIWLTHWGFHREQLPHRAFSIVGADGALTTVARSRVTRREIVFFFSGQGAQWPGMGRELLRKSPQFQADIRALDRHLQQLPNATGWSIEDELLNCDDLDRMSASRLAQPLCTAVQIGLVNLLREWGDIPSMVAGHASGEIAAAYASGATSAETAITIAYRRGQAVNTANSSGAMAAVGLGIEEAKSFLKEGVVIACDNSPKSVTLSGDKELLVEIIRDLEAKEVFCRRLAVNVAYHSHHMKSVGEAYERRLGNLMFNTTMVPLYSTVTGETIMEPGQLTAAYWRQNLESPVLFKTAIQNLLSTHPGSRSFGPHSVLEAPLRHIISQVEEKQRPEYTPTLVRGKEPWECLLRTTRHLHIRGVSIDLSKVIPRAKVLTDLPPYYWTHDERFWSETRMAHDWRLRETRHHELLGSRCLESTNVEPVWRNLLQLDNVLWLLDHRITGEVVFPCAAYVAMAGEEVRQVSNSDDYTIQNLFIRAALVLSGDEPEGIELITSLRPHKLADNVDSHWYEFTISSYQHGVWTKYCVGQIRAGSIRRHPDTQVQAYLREVSLEKWYAALEARGLEYGAHFRGLRKITASPSSSRAAAELQDSDNYYLLSVAATQGISRRMTRLCIPTAIQDLYVTHARDTMQLNVSCDMTGGMMTGEAFLAYQDRVVLSMQHATFFGVSESALEDTPAPPLSTSEWRPNTSRIEKTHAQICDRNSNLVPEIRDKFANNPTARWPYLEASLRKSLPPSSADPLALAERILSNITEILDNQVNPLELLMQDDGLQHLYANMPSITRWEEYLATLAHSKPTLRVLEIGGGTGGTTSAELDGLSRASGPNKGRMYDKYTFTDISATFLAPAKERFKQHEGMEYRTLDISKDPREQEFESESYDLLLAPEGRLLLQELSHDVPIFDYIMGALPSWWLANDGSERPYLSPEQWHHALLEAGFTGTDVVRLDNEAPYHVNANMLSRVSSPRACERKALNLLYHDPIPEWARQLETQLLLHGWDVQWLALGTTPAENTDVISLLDVESPFLHTITRENYDNFQKSVASLRGHLIWPTRPIHPLVLRQDIGVKAMTIELDEFDDDAIRGVLGVLDAIKAHGEETRFEFDHEFALHDGLIHVPRFRWYSTEHAMSSVQSCVPRAMVVKCFGILDSIDIMVSMGLMGSTDEIGIDGSGIVRRVGTAVATLQVGESVVLSGTGLMCIRKVLPADFCYRIPTQMNLADAAATPCIFLTAMYSLVTVADIQPGQSVLIHSACGGVGLASIQICQMLGAEIYVTARSPEKRQYLMDQCAISEDHIFDSRSTSFVSGIMERNKNRGVDVVLNSLAGELLHASWRCVAAYGKMVELGKRDFLGHGKLDMDMFGGNRAFFGVDLFKLGLERPDVVRETMSKLMKLHEDRTLQPIQPINMFDAADAVRAFRLMQTGQHIGKIVIRMPVDPSTLQVTGAHVSSALFRSDVAYLLVGGLGGLGRAIATWMVERGARNFVFLSRSGSSALIVRSFIEDLKAQAECEVTVIQGTAVNLDDVDRAVRCSPKPLAGVIQMSMVLQFDQWTVWYDRSSQLRRCEHLSGRLRSFRRAQDLPAHVLDLGFMGDIGYIAEKSQRTMELNRTLRMQVLSERDLLQVLELAVLNGPPQVALGISTSATSTEGIAKPWWARDIRFAAWSHLSNTEGPDLDEQEDKLRYFLVEIDKDSSILNHPDTENQFTYELGKMIATHMSYPEDMELAELAAIAIDSLMAIEIRSWFRRHFKVEISLLEIANAGTVGGLGKATMRILRAKYASEELKPGDAGALLDADRGKTDDVELCQRDWELGRDLHPVAGTASEWHTPGEGRVLLTGATGFLGAYLLSLLVGLPHVQQVMCLVRAPDAETGLSRIKKAFHEYGLQLDLESKLKAVPGDLVDPMLGLGAEQYAELAQWANVNVMGLYHLLRFANTGRLKPFHYTSSISAWGTVIHLTGAMVPEDERPTFDPEALKQLFGYAHSKVVAEQVAWNAIANGFPVTIHRPGYVTAHSVTGMSKASDLVNYLMSSCIRLGSYPAAPNIRNQFTPVDFCCSALLRLSLAPASLGHAFNILRPDQSQTVTFEETFEPLSRECSSPLRRLPTAEWIEEFRQGADPRLRQGSSMMIDTLHEFINFWRLDAGTNAYFDTRKLRQALEEFPELLAVPSMGELMHTYFRAWAES